MTETDKEILRLCRKKSTRESGFKKLVYTYQEKLYRHLRTYLLYHEDADDALQNTFLKAYTGLSGFRGDASLYSWMYRIAANEALTMLRKKKNSLKISTDIESEVGIATRLVADPWFDGDQIQILLRSAIEKLPWRQKMVFCMRYFDEMSYKEISSHLKVTVGALKASYHHALKKIEKELKELEV